MFLAWLGHRGQAIREEDQQRIREAITPWIEGVVIPLRRLRYRWTDVASMAINRRHILGLELEAERVLAALLVDALPLLEPTNGEAASEVDRNLAFLPELQNADIRARVTDILRR
jgi:hypothetical protein